MKYEAQNNSGACTFISIYLFLCLMERMIELLKRYFSILCLSLAFISCGDDDDDDDNGSLVGDLIDELTGLTPENDVTLGMQISNEINSNPDEFPILDLQEYADSYAYLNAMRDDILASNDIEFRDLFAWELRIIGDDNTLNAFATPGGYIYVYTGLIKFLDSADDLAGVMGHEIAHADLRHSSNQLQQRFGLSLLSQIIFGEGGAQLANVATQIGSLAFSRDDEAESDEYSVVYLADTDYACNGAAAFFQKLLDSNQSGGTPEFLSTHPSPDNRVEDINAQAAADGCSTDMIVETGMTYDDFKASLP